MATKAEIKDVQVLHSGTSTEDALIPQGTDNGQTRTTIYSTIWQAEETPSTLDIDTTHRPKCYMDVILMLHSLYRGHRPGQEQQELGVLICNTSGLITPAIQV